jgi:galactitol-specific phosphotransferase system IIB component
MTYENNYPVATAATFTFNLQLMVGGQVVALLAIDAETYSEACHIAEMSISVEQADILVPTIHLDKDFSKRVKK